MLTSVTPVSQNMILLPGFETDRSVTILQIMRTISPRHATLRPPRPTPPYARDQYVTLFNQFYMLITRIPIARQDTSHNMDFFAISDHFLPDDPSSSSPSPSSSPSSSSPSPSSSPSSSSSLTLTPNTTPPVLPSASITTAETPSIHRYPPPTPHINQQLGEAWRSQSWTWKGLMENVWLYILVIGLGLIIIGVLVIASTFH
ncbi:hypothetical protein M422DRAFT_269805 [Sphaerobolus stellatus SS14]|uniref:Uncharacterized protein n=1 Tax=Sphaerobolus stellatus (strain SS14) TaxID=990650 RepID=A0A0C9U3S3_SPHS4|nr:hypothetical protein M422DRAFT_269805 [Sphaerobolus stellatus SS14]